MILTLHIYKIMKVYLQKKYVMGKENKSHTLYPQTGQVWNVWKVYCDSARHRSQDICQIVLNTFIKISLIIKECPEENLIKLAIVLTISKSSWNPVSIINNGESWLVYSTIWVSGTCMYIKMQQSNASSYFLHNMEI